MIVNAEHEDADVGDSIVYQRRRLESRDRWHGEVEHDHIGTQRFGERHDLGAIRRLANYLEAVVCRKHLADTLANDGMIICDQNANGRARRLRHGD